MTGARLTPAEVYARALGTTVAKADAVLARAWREAGLSPAYIESILRKRRWHLNRQTIGKREGGSSR